MDTTTRTLERAAIMGDEHAAEARVTNLVRTLDVAELERMARPQTGSRRTPEATSAAAGLVTALVAQGEAGEECLARLAGSWGAGQDEADAALAVARLARGEAVYAFEFSPAGPCLSAGRVVKASAKFFTCEERHGERKRISKSKVHTVRCDRCSGGAQYPRGYDN